MQAAEASLIARQAQDSAREAGAKAALLEARLNEVAVQRSQLEALVQSVARSRDENLVGDGEAALRAGLQQSALTGSAEPLVAALKQLDDRLARANQPRLEPVRHAIARDLERVKAANVADVATLSIKLDEATRMVDELPLLSVAEPRRDLARGGRARPVKSRSPPRRLRRRPPGQRERQHRRVALRAHRRGRRLSRRQRLDRDPVARPHHPHRPAGSDAGRARSGVLPEGEPEAAPAQRAACR